MTTASIMFPTNIPLSLVLILIPSFMAVLWIVFLVEIFMRRGDDTLLRLQRRRARKTQSGSGIIAYKRAIMTELQVVDNSQALVHLDLTGVTGFEYASDADARDSSIGFHAYRNIHEAINHPQRANVVLEVLLSGDVDVHGLGYEARHQRVLQVLINPEDRREIWQWGDRQELALHRRLRRLALSGKTWTDQHGTQIVFASTKPIRSGRRRAAAFTPTQINPAGQDSTSAAA